MYNVGLTREPLDSIGQVGALPQAENFSIPRSAFRAGQAPPRLAIVRRARRAPRQDPSPAAGNDEAVSPQIFHLVERSDAQHALAHTPSRRIRRPRRIRQSLLSHARRRDRSGARLRSALGDLQRRVRGFDDAAGLERLAASHCRRAAEPGRLSSPRDWERPHIGNPTGTPAAIRPKGSTMRRGARQASSGDYQAWTPEG